MRPWANLPIAVLAPVFVAVADVAMTMPRLVVAAESQLPAERYERLADVFSRVYEATNDIAITLEVLDAHRAREVIARPRSDLAARVLAVAAATFHVIPPRRLLQPGRHRDICSARWVASWILRRQGWSTVKVGRYLGLDHSTVLHGLRRVAERHQLLICARDAEARLQLEEPSAT